MGDAELIDHAVEAGAAGEAESAERALQIFAFGMEGPLRAMVRNRLDSHGDTVIDEIAERALEDAIRSIHRLRGQTPQEARAFVFRIARLRIVDFHRSGRVRTEPIDTDPDADRGAGAEAEADGLRVEGESDAVDTALVLEQALAEMREDHRAVVELFVVSGHNARETAERVASRFDGRLDDSMSEQNVHQIGSRFRKDLRRRLEGAERTS